jgi:hypothetical protein
MICPIVCVCVKLMIQLDGEDSQERLYMLHLQKEDTSDVPIVICYMERTSRKNMKRWRELSALKCEYWERLIALF